MRFASTRNGETASWLTGRDAVLFQPQIVDQLLCDRVYAFDGGRAILDQVAIRPLTAYNSADAWLGLKECYRCILLFEPVCSCQAADASANDCNRNHDVYQPPSCVSPLYPFARIF